MSQKLAEGFEKIVREERESLCRITDAQAAIKPSPEDWSQKEELGHLIDSATNNHVRFVLAALQPELRGPGYEQDNWVRLHGYNELPWATLVGFWHDYNELLAHLVRRIPAEKMETPCTIGSGATVTLRFVIEDYILHMQHHLDHILRREIITPYPSMASPVR